MMTAGVRKLELSSWNSFLLAWPTLVVEFSHLQTLAVTGFDIDPNMIFWTPNLLHLPRTLKNIDFAFPGCFESMCHALAEDPSHFSGLESLKLKVCKGTQPVSHPSFRMGALPRGLTTLHLNLGLSPHSAEDAVTVEDMPPTLTSLALLGIGYKPPKADFVFPNTLTDFSSSQLGGGFKGWVHHLPQEGNGEFQLLSVSTTLEVPSTDGGDVSFLSQTRAIPRSVTSLHFFVPYPPTMSLTSRRSFGTEELMALPPKLRRMHWTGNVPHLSLDLILLLPRTLEEMPWFSLPSPLTPDLLRILPPAMTVHHISDWTLLPHLLSPLSELRLFHDELDEFPSNISFPSSLSILQVGKLTTTAAKRFLPSLSRLAKLFIQGVVLGKEENFGDIAKYFPASLQQLSVICDPQSDPNEIFCQNLPQGLSLLEISSDSRPDGALKLKHNSSKHIPRNLQELGLSSPATVTEFEPGWISGLPASLVGFAVTCDLRISHMLELSTACPHLEVFHITMPKAVSKSNMDDKLAWIPFLPHRLQDLLIIVPPEIGEVLVLDALYMSRLPRTLTTMQVSGSIRLHQNCAKVLPRALRVLLDDNDIKWFKPWHTLPRESRS
jgi:hypothetical protein